MIPRARRTLGIILCISILLHIGLILKYGIFITERHDQPTFEQMKLQKQETINITAYPGEGLFSSVVTCQMDNSFIEPYLAKLYTEVIPVSSQYEAYKKMSRHRLPQQIFIEGIDEEKARLMNEVAGNMRKGDIKLTYSSYNRVVFNVFSETPSFFGLSYPYTGYWKAWVNGEPVRIYRANGGYNAVKVPEGESVVEFRYWSPAAFWGLVISCSTFILIGLYFTFVSMSGFRRLLTSILLIGIGAGTAILWYQSLYTGDNLETKYSWHYTTPSSNPNIAYGKKTSHLPVPKGIYYYWYLKGGQYINHDSRVVDGNRQKGSGFMIPPKDTPNVFVDMKGNVIHLDNNKELRDRLYPDVTPSITIDLANITSIKSVLTYASKKDDSEVECIFEYLISSNGNNWQSIASIIPDLDSNNPVRIDLDSPQPARYLKLKISGSRKVIIDEIEIYRSLEGIDE